MEKLQDFRKSEFSLPLTKLEDKEKSVWKGLDTEIVGLIGQGIGNLLSSRKDSLIKSAKEPSDKPPLVVFSPVTECQLVKESLFFTAYTKSVYTQPKELLYKLYKTEGRLVRSVLENSGFSYTESNDWNLMWLGAVPQLFMFENLNEHQRINHFPNSYELTKKDRMSVHLKHMQLRHGVEQFGFFPETFIIPEEYSEFYSKFNSEKSAQWIVKPCNSSQGKGIFLLDSLYNLPTAEGCVVSRYINNPLLINNLKFDLRIYVLVSSYSPLRVYVYDEGLARFASEAYNSTCRASRYSFLTNYSVNKKNEKFVQNSDSKADNIGHKWSFSALLKFLNSQGVETKTLISKIYDIVIKSVISIEPSVVNLSKKIGLRKNNCFDLFGFDILIDSHLKPWLLEVNLSPSLATDSPLDLFIKSNLIADTLNLVGVRFYDRKKESLSKLRARIRARNTQFRQFDLKHRKKEGSESGFSKFKHLITDLLEEAGRLGNFLRIFPVEGCDFYERFFAVKRNSNKALLSFILIENKEVISEALPTLKESEKELERDKNKIVITGDDILIEYLCRVLHACKSVTVDNLKEDWRLGIEKFVNHQIWGGGLSSFNLIQKFETRIDEMKEKKKKGENLNKDAVYTSQKLNIVRGFSAAELEKMLKSSNKNIVRELVSFFFFGNDGLLSEIIKWLACSSAKRSKIKNVRKNESLVNEDLEKKVRFKKVQKAKQKDWRNGSFLKDLQSRVKEKIMRPGTSQGSNSNSVELE